MNDFERDYHLAREKTYNLEQNRAELERLLDQASEMRHELNEGRLSEAAKKDLEERLANTNRAMLIIRESIQALKSPDAVVVEDNDDQLAVEITDYRAYWSNEYNIKRHELDDVLKEYESCKDVLYTEMGLTKIKRMEAEIAQLKNEVEEALKNVERIQTG